MSRNEIMRAFWEDPEKSTVRRKNIQKANARRARVQHMVLPLALRRATVEEMMGVCDLNRAQIENARTRLRHNGLLPRPSGEDSSEVRKRATTGKKLVIDANGRKRVVRSEYSQHQRNSMALARKLFTESLVATDVTSWNLLKELYRREQRGLPKEFSDQLRLEVFFAAARRNDMELLAKYRELGDSIDPVWFDRSLAKEENFIAIHASVGVSLREDRGGFFTDNKHGSWRPLVEGGVDNSQLARERQRSRERISMSRPAGKRS